MTSPPSDDWSTPSLYSRGDMIEPPSFGGADPISSVLVADWDLSVDAETDAAARAADAASTGMFAAVGTDAAQRKGGDPVWSTPTYSGPRRLRPGATPAETTIRRRGRADGPVTRHAAPDDTVAPPADAGEHPGLEVGPLDGATEQSAAVADERSNRSLLSTSRTLAVASLTSRVTGFVRSIMIVAALGIAQVGNAYNSGNNFPNQIYELLLGGVLSSVLIPLLVHAQDRDDDQGVAYTQRLLSIATAVLAGMTIVAVALAPVIAGYFAEPAERHLTTVFATLLLPEIFFYGLGAMFMAVLNIRHVYAPGAWAPVLNNVIMIVTVIVFWALPGPSTLTPSSITTAQVLVIGIGTTLGIAAQALVLVPYLRRSGFHWRWRFRARPDEVGRMKEVGTLAGWVLAYVVASQVGVSVIQKVGNRNGGFSVFTQVDLLFQVPYGILVVSLLTAIMPRLSRAAVRGDNDAVVADLALGSRLSAVALVPITAGMVALGVPLGVTLFAHGRTSVSGGELIGSSLALSAFGLLPFAVVMLQLRVFYAMRDGRTPTLINAFMVATKVALVLVTDAAFRAPKGTDVNLHPSVHAVEWLNIATSFSYVIGAVVGHVALSRRLGRLGFRPVLATVVRIGVASAIAAAAAYAVVLTTHAAFGRGHVSAATGLIGGGLVGLVVLPAVAYVLRISEIREVVGYLRRR